MDRFIRRLRALFPMELWNVRDRVERALPLTNNSVEGWHRAFDIRINTTHPCVSKLIRKIILEQNDNEITSEKVRIGHQLPQSKMKYIQLNKRIEKMVDEYIYIPHLEYLLAYNKTYLSNIFILVLKVFKSFSPKINGSFVYKSKIRRFFRKNSLISHEIFVTFSDPIIQKIPWQYSDNYLQQISSNETFL